MKGGIIMKNSQNLAETIEILAKEKGTSVSSILQELDMNKNALFTMKKSGYLPRIESLCKFADYFQCSLDFLLGRTDNPNGHNNINNFDTTVSGTQVSGNNATINKTISPEDKELLELIKNLTLIERSKVILFIDEMKNKEL